MIIRYKKFVHQEILQDMKTLIDKQFDAVRFMRQQRDKLSGKLNKMTKVEIIEYFKKRSLESQTKPSA